MQTPLEVIGLTKDYGGKDAVKDISFKLNENEIIGILGPNGCGKTTTIGMILGLLKPSKGKVLINGSEIENQREDIRYIQALVVSVGDEVSGVKNNDNIFYDRHAGHKIEFDKETYHVIKAQDVVIVT